jgi:tRNA pseudouridine38-40 synthase
MRGVLLTVAYEGTAFSGWAAQAPGESRTVEETVFAAVRAVDPKASKLRGVSRTDAGVHAEAQKAAFDAALEGIDSRGWVMAINANLPDDVALREARSVPAGFNPRHSSKWKRYRYRLLFDMVRDPLERTRSWRVGYSMDTERMKRACALLEGTHDFGAFRTARDERPTTVRTLSHVAVEPLSPHVVSVVVTGDAFMHNMVRIMVGTLVDIGRGKLDDTCITRAFETKKRDALGMTAPAHGLTLEHVELDLPAETGAPWPP